MIGTTAASRAGRGPCRAVSACVLLLGTVAACATGSDAGPAVTVRDSAGITIVENPAALLTGTLPVSPEPLVSIGVAEGAPEYQLFGVRDVARLSDGRIVIANLGTGEVRWYAPDGTHLVTAGGKGEGPHEMRSGGLVLALPGDTVQAEDRGDRLIFDPQGRFVRRVTFDRTEWTLWPDHSAQGGVWLPNGTRFVSGNRRGGGPEPGPYRPQQLLAIVAADRSRIDTVGFFGGILQERVDFGGGQMGNVVPPYAVGTSWTVADDGAVAVGDSQHPQVLVLRPDGSRTIVRWAAAPELLTAADVEAWKEMQRNATWTQGQLPQLERAWSLMTLPEQKAYYGFVSAGSGGSLWVNRDGDLTNPSRWLVFDEVGRARGTATFPGPFIILHADAEHVLGLHFDENQVEHVRMYRVGTP